MSNPPSIRDLASGTGLMVNVAPEHQHVLQELATKVVNAATELFPDATAQLEQPLSAGARALVAHIKTQHLSQEKQRAADELSQTTLSLRGLFSYAVHEPIADPYPDDVLTTDMNNVTLPHCVVPDLHRKGLGPKYYGEATDKTPVFPLRGILFGWNYRPIVTIIFEFGGRKIQLPVFIDTGAIRTCLNESSWEKLAPNVNIHEWSDDDRLSVMVHGVPSLVYKGTGNASGVNMVGKDWLQAAQAFLVAGYSCGGCIIDRDTAVTRSLHPQLPKIWVQ